MKFCIQKVIDNKFFACVRVCLCVCVKMLQEYWASTVIFIGIFSQCAMAKQDWHYSLYKYSINIKMNYQIGNNNIKV